MSIVASLLLLTAGADPLTVSIARPAGGWSNTRVVTVDATITGKAERAKVVINGVAFDARITSGAVHQRLVLSRGPNAIEVIASDEKTVARDRVHLISEIPRIDLQVFLIFDPQPFYVDLWLTEPNGEKCYWGSRETKNAGILHDLYNDAPGGGVGLGPQTYTIANAPAGRYLVQVDYYAGGSWGEGESEGGGVYGSHRQEPVPVRVEVVQYEGTAHERRQTFTAMLAKPSDTYTIGTIVVDPPAARGDKPFDPDRALGRKTEPSHDDRSSTKNGGATP